MAFVSNSSPSEDNQNGLGTDLSIINTEDEKHIDTTNWTPPKWKKLQHMTEFHEEYQWIFGERASIHTIMKRRISHMNPPMPDSVCKEERQNATIENDVIIEYITDDQGRKVKKLKPLLIKAEPDREYINIYIVCMGSRFYRNRGFIASDCIWITKCCRRLFDFGFPYIQISLI